MKIDKTGLGLPHDRISAYKVNSSGAEEEQLSPDKTRNKKSADTVELSAKAKKLFEAQKANQIAEGDNTLKQALIQSKVADSPEQAERISGKVSEKMETNTFEREQRLELIKQRIAENFYNSPEVIDKIANGLMRDMHLKE